MTELPDLGNPSVAQHTLSLGFSYSLTPDGSPGSYNEIIAQSIRASLQKTVQHGKLPWTGMQWEIFDAVVDHDQTDDFKIAPYIPDSHVASPPRFKPDEIALSEFVNYLNAGATKACHELLSNLSVLEDLNFDTILNAEQLVSCLNRFLDKRNNFQAYTGLLELHDLHRPDLGSVGTEKRNLPNSDIYPNGLRRFQAMRVNRLIVEAICPDRNILKSGKYLSTKGVLDLLLPQALQEDRKEIKYIFVYGHPHHSPRCKWQTEQSLLEHNLKVSTVYDIHQGQDWSWDPSTAQVWCRSLDNWTDYENMGKKRL